MYSILVAAAVVLVPQNSVPQSGGPDLSKKITFESVAMPAKPLLAKLGKIVGANLETSMQTAGDVLVVRFQNVTAKEALDKIALAINGEWKPEENALRLIRPQANDNREAAAEQRERIVELQKDIKAQITALNKQSEAGKPDEDPEMAGAMAGLPFGGAEHQKSILTLISRLNVADLASAMDGGRIVFASTPTRMQKLLPGNLTPIVNEIVTAHNAAAKARATAEKHEPDTDEERQLMEFVKAFGLFDEPKEVNTRPAKLLLVAETPQLFGGFTLKLRLYDVQGKVVLETSTMLGMGSFMEDAMEMANPKAKPAPGGEDLTIEFSKETKELSQLFGGMMNPGGRKKISSELEAKLLRPDLYDPLSFGIAESLLASAKHRKVSLVAYLPDSTYSMLEYFMDGGTSTVNNFMNQMEQSESVKVEKSAGWYVLRPKQPYQARQDRIDRVGLARLVGAAKSKGTVGLDDIAAYAQTSPSPFGGASAALQYLMLFAPNAMQMGMTGMVDWEAVKFYGQLGLAQRQALIQGGRLSFAQLSPSQRFLVEKMMFGPRADLQQIDPNAPPAEGGFDFLKMMTSFMGGKQTDYRQEPTEIMPNGLPPNGYFTMRATKEPVAKAESDDPMLGHAMLGADELALFRMFKDMPNGEMVAQMMPTIGQVRLGERTNYHLKFFAASDVALERTLQDNSVGAGGGLYTMDTLPADFKALIDKRYQALKKSPLGAFPNLGVGRQIPPP